MNIDKIAQDLEPQRQIIYMILKLKLQFSVFWTV